MKVPRNIFAISGVCDPEFDRYALGTVQFSHSGGRGFAYATNGCSLIAAEWEGEEGAEDVEPVLVPQSSCEAATWLWKGPGDGLMLSGDGVSDSHGNAIHYNAGEGRFPPCQEAFVEQADAVNVRVDLVLLKQLVDTLVAMGKGRDVINATLSIRSNCDMVVLSASEDKLLSISNVAGILMVTAARDGKSPSGPAWTPEQPGK